jgi:hypothetical protein
MLDIKTTINDIRIGLKGNPPFIHVTNRAVSFASLNAFLPYRKTQLFLSVKIVCG